MLLDLDVPCHSRNFDKKTPYELAMANGHTDCAQMLGKCNKDLKTYSLMTVLNCIHLNSLTPEILLLRIRSFQSRK